MNKVLSKKPKNHGESMGNSSDYNLSHISYLKKVPSIIVCSFIIKVTFKSSYNYKKILNVSFHKSEITNAEQGCY